MDLKYKITNKLSTEEHHSIFLDSLCKQSGMNVSEFYEQYFMSLKNNEKNIKKYKELLDDYLQGLYKKEQLSVFF